MSDAAKAAAKSNSRRSPLAEEADLCIKLKDPVKTLLVPYAISQKKSEPREVSERSLGPWLKSNTNRLRKKNQNRERLSFE